MLLPVATLRPYVAAQVGTATPMPVAALVGIDSRDDPDLADAAPNHRHPGVSVVGRRTASDDGAALSTLSARLGVSRMRPGDDPVPDCVTLKIVTQITVEGVANCRCIGSCIGDCTLQLQLARKERIGHPRLTWPFGRGITEFPIVC